MLEKNGLCLEGIERKVKYRNGEMHDRLHYAILKEDYYKYFVKGITLGGVKG